MLPVLGQLWLEGWGASDVTPTHTADHVEVSTEAVGGKVLSLSNSGSFF